MQQDRALRRNALIVSVVLAVIFGWPLLRNSVFGPNSKHDSMDVRSVSRLVLGSWKSAMLTLAFDEQGLCIWNGGTAEPCGFYDAEHVPSFIEERPAAGSIYLESGIPGAKRGYRVLSATADTLQLMALPDGTTTVYARGAGR